MCIPKLSLEVVAKVTPSLGLASNVKLLLEWFKMKVSLWVVSNGKYLQKLFQK